MKKMFAAMVAALLLASLASGVALAGNGFPPIMATGGRTQTDVGSCNNDWATVTLTKDYKLTLTTTGVYNLEVKEDGSLTTLAGVSPGACESGINNGNTVAAGITGRTHQTFDAPVTSSATPNLNPACTAPCASSSDFLNAVFGTGNYTSGYATGNDSWTAHYEAGSNGTYFDTSVNWPLNNRGDITGS